ncbi:hypothetical protein C1752_00008 [Acaryochloris thomasi RCC1774]|uniref:Uncharacterized protein n=1 Tax=Acaryochloris thomasi RCC1774 TaxID=1764569 RepID=A0A2W1JQ83_9CYAN|nr:hypothetical protein C1752_00008 [Acaryochloris thomasi RCC1774]
MKGSSLPKTNRQIVRKTTLVDAEALSDYADLSPEERLLMVWPLTVTAWKFKDPRRLSQYESSQHTQNQLWAWEKDNS